MHHGTCSKSKVKRSQIEEVNKTGCEKFRVCKARQVGGRKPRRYFRIDGGSGPDWDIPNNDIESVSHAVLERVFFVKDTGNGGFKRSPKPWDHHSVRNNENPMKDSEEKLRLRFREFAAKMNHAANTFGKASPITNQEFLDYYGGAKRKCYEAAVKSFNDRPLDERDCKVKCFTKDEYRKPGGAPRVIQPRSPRFNVMLGRYIKHLEHEIFSAIDEIFDPTKAHRTVAKGMNMTQRGNTIASMWDSFNDPVAVGLDASRFDQHINQILLKYEHSIYKMWSTGKGEGLVDLRKLLKAQLVNKGVYRGPDGSIKYTVKGCRMSGDMNTSSGNVIIMCTLMYAYFKSKNLLHSVKLLNDGEGEATG